MRLLLDQSVGRTLDHPTLREPAEELGGLAGCPPASTGELAAHGPRGVGIVAEIDGGEYSRGEVVGSDNGPWGARCSSPGIRIRG